MTIQVKLISRTSPIPYEITCDLEDFKPRDIADIIAYVEGAITEIMKEVKVV